MSANLSSPVVEQALARLVVEVAAITDNGSLALFKSVGRGIPIKQGQIHETLPCAFINVVDQQPESRQSEETAVERVLFGVIILGEAEAETDAQQMTALSTELTKLCEAVKRGTTTGIEGTTLNGWCPGKLHWVKTYTPLIAQNLLVNSIMPVFGGHLCHPRTDPFAT